jgi:hypothetical protein
LYLLQKFQNQPINHSKINTMDYYKPTLSNLLFVYNHISNNLSIKSTVKVMLQAGESLTLTSSYNDATKTAQKLFDYAQNPSQLLPYEFVEDSSIVIISNVPIPYDEHDQQGFINRLRGIMANEYIVIATVKDKPDHSATGGSDTKILNKNGTLAIN